MQWLFSLYRRFSHEVTKADQNMHFITSEGKKCRLSGRCPLRSGSVATLLSRPCSLRSQPSDLRSRRRASRRPREATRKTGVPRMRSEDASPRTACSVAASLAPVLIALATERPAKPAPSKPAAERGDQEDGADEATLGRQAMCETFREATIGRRRGRAGQRAPRRRGRAGHRAPRPRKGRTQSTAPLVP